MANQAFTPQYVAHGINESNDVMCEVAAGAILVMANADTLTLTLPANVDPAALPVLVIAFTNATPQVAQPLIAITSHNQTTGVTILTASGAVAAGSKILVRYQQAN